MKEYKKISCEHHEEIKGFRTSLCNAPKECIYNSTYQEYQKKAKLCKVGGIVDPKNIQKNLISRLSPKDLEANITMSIYSN